MQKTLLFYCHNFGGLGHNKRLSLIIREIENNFSDYKIIFLNSGKKEDFLFDGFKNTKVINLPTFEFEESEILNSKNNLKIQDLRKLFIKKIIESYNIEKIIIEHFPFGRNFLQDELNFLINYYKKINKEGNIIASLRDILDINSLNRKNLGYFDRFLVHSDENISNLKEFNLEEIKNKIIYTGYVVENLNFKRKNEKNIIINIGGGQDGFEYVLDFLTRFSNIKNSFQYKIIISLNGQYNEENIKKIESFNLNTEIHENIKNLLEYKINSSLSVSMGGYNNLVESLKYGFKTIIYPRNTDEEQLKRLDVFKKYGNNIFSYDEDLEEVLNKKIILKEKDIDFNGAYFSANFITNFRKYKYIKIRLTNACNAKCDMCGVIKRKREYNNLEKIKKSILDFYKIGGEIVNFTGGEPTIFKGFWELLQYSKTLGLVTSVSTNGSTLGEEFFKKLYFENVRLIDYIDISVDGLYEKQDIRRNYKGLFKIIDKNLEILKENKIFIHINVTIRKDNIGEMKEIFDYFKSKNIDSISFGMITSSPINDTTFLIPEKKDIFKFYNSDKKYIISKKGDTKITFSPDFTSGDFEKFYNSIENKNFFPRISGEKCSFINSKKEIRINENGDISPCCEIDDFSILIGNINETDLLNIIISEKYENFLNKTFPNISPACLNCKIGINE